MQESSDGYGNEIWCDLPRSNAFKLDLRDAIVIPFSVRKVLSRF